MPEDNCVFIGNKPFMNYVTAVVMQFTTQGANEVRVMARGKFICRAVDVAQVAAKRFLQGTVGVGEIRIDSEEFTNKEGKQVRVSTIEIKLGRLEGVEPQSAFNQKRKEEPREQTPEPTEEPREQTPEPTEEPKEQTPEPTV